MLFDRYYNDILDWVKSLTIITETAGPAVINLKNKTDEIYGTEFDQSNYIVKHSMFNVSKDMVTAGSARSLIQL